MAVLWSRRQPPALAPALQDLARARALERALRLVLWAWCGAVVLWLLPLGEWSATALAPGAAMVVGAALATWTVLLVLLHRSVSRTDGIRGAVAEARHLSARVQQSRPASQALLAEWVSSPATVGTLAAAVLLAAPLLHQAGVFGREPNAVWLLHPIAGLLLAARWKMRGALLGIAASLGLFGLIDGGIEAWSALADPDARGLLVMTILLDTAVPLAVAGIVLRLSRVEDLMGFTEEDLRAAARARRLQRASESRLRPLLQNAADVMMIMDADGIRRDVSPSVARVLGYGPQELVDTSFFALIHPDDTERVLAFHLERLDTPGVSPPIEFRCRDRDGSWRHLEAIFNNLLADPMVGGIVVNARDITERKRFEEQLARQAYNDALTGLPNRACFMERLTEVFGAARRQYRPFAVMFLDLDRFKVINDSLGHGAGDALLVGVAQRLSACLRPGDIVARFGGGEFTVMLPEVVSAADAVHVAERMIEALRRPFNLEGHEVFTAASIGIALSNPAHTSPSELLRDADVAVYQAKGAGKGRAVLFDPAMNEQAVERLDLETDLRRAVERGELRLHYQPEVDLSAGAIVGVEALLRWQHPRLGLIQPAEFIALAEETGLIVPIGRWVLAEACRQARAWMDLRREGERPLVMSVNLSVRQFEQPGLVEQVGTILRETGLAPAGLRLEITESVMVRDTEATLRVLRGLKALGVGLAIDDFGTGYSSLNYLTSFMADTLKIDQSFVSRMGHDEKAVAIVGAVTALAKALGMAVTAEGIETVEQLTSVRGVACDQAQGFYFSRPITGAALTEVLEHGPAWATVA